DQEQGQKQGLRRPRRPRRLRAQEAPSAQARAQGAPAPLRQGRPARPGRAHRQHAHGADRLQRRHPAARRPPDALPLALAAAHLRARLSRPPHHPRHALAAHPAQHGLLHRPAVRAVPVLHRLQPDRPPLPHHRRHRRQQGPQRQLLDQQDLLARRRHLRPRTRPARARVPVARRVAHRAPAREARRVLPEPRRALRRLRDGARARAHRPRARPSPISACKAPRGLRRL
ncbi:hypothetical protein LOZ39_004651, partial [Ophidiomyces ophidiicola]